MAKKCELGKKFIHCKEKSTRGFDKRSFRVKESGGVKLTLGCPLGKYDAKKERCKVGMHVQKVMHLATASNKRKLLRKKKKKR